LNALERGTLYGSNYYHITDSAARHLGTVGQIFLRAKVALGFQDGEAVLGQVDDRHFAIVGLGELSTRR